MWERPPYPFFYVPAKDLKNCTLKVKREVDVDGKFKAQVVELSVTAENGQEAKTDRVLRFADESSWGVLAGLVRLEFGSMGECTWRMMDSSDEDWKCLLTCHLRPMA